MRWQCTALLSISTIVSACAQGDELEPSGGHASSSGAQGRGGSPSEGGAGASSSEGAAAPIGGAGGDAPAAGGSSTDAGGTAGDGGASQGGANLGGSGEGGGVLGEEPDGTASTVLSVFGGVGSSSIVGNSLNVTNGSGFGTPFTEQTSERIALAMTGAGMGVLVVRATASGELRYGLWNGAWSPGFGAHLATVEAGVTLSGGPSIAVSGSTAHVAYRRDDGKFYYAAYQSGVWSPSSEPIGAGVDQSTGLAPPTIGMANADPIVVFVGTNGDLFDRRRVGGVWQPAAAHGLTGVGSISPSVASLHSGPDTLVVFADSAHALRFTTLSGSSWSAPEPITGAASHDVVSLTALPSSGAALAYRALDGSLHAAIYNPTETPPWSEPAGLPVATIVGPPSVASGGQGARAELIYVDQSYLVYSSRLVAGAWTAPVFTSSSGERIAITSGL